MYTSFIVLRDRFFWYLSFFLCKVAIFKTEVLGKLESMLDKVLQERPVTAVGVRGQ